MNIRSQFIRIFFQEILDMRDAGILDLFREEYTRSTQEQNCNQSNPKEKPLGYKKLAFLFAVLASGTFISLLVVLFEFFVLDVSN